MSPILNVESVKIENLKYHKRKTKKTQILLYDTKRRYDDFIKMIKYRKNGNFQDVPHFCINKFGKIIKLIEPLHTTPTFNDTKIDNKQIKIALENLGWLNKNTITGFYNNWIGDPFRGKPFVRNWRNHYFWDNYTNEQLTSLADLCLVLCVEYNIDYKCVPSSGYIENAKNLTGIVSKSNFTDIYTDINPAFNFNIFEENVKQTEHRI